MKSIWIQSHSLYEKEIKEIIGNIIHTYAITDVVEDIRVWLPQQYKLKAAVKMNHRLPAWLIPFWAKMWGVNYIGLTKHLDAICPMFYTAEYGANNKQFSSALHFMNLICKNKVEPILQAYFDPKDNYSNYTPEIVREN